MSSGWQFAANGMGANVDPTAPGGGFGSVEWCHGEIGTVSGLPSEDIVVLESGTLWQVPWQLMMLGPFVSCGLIDGTFIRHLTVPAMVASAVRWGSTPDAVLAPGDYTPMPVFAAEMPLLDAAVLVMETGWDLAVVMAGEPRVITARSVYRGLAGSSALSAAPALMPRPCDGMSLSIAEVRS